MNQNPTKLIKSFSIVVSYLLTDGAPSSHGTPVVGTRARVTFGHLLTIFPPLASIGDLKNTPYINFHKHSSTWACNQVKREELKLQCIYKLMEHTNGASDLARTETLAFLKGTSAACSSLFEGSTTVGLFGEPQLWDDPWSGPSPKQVCFPVLGILWCSVSFDITSVVLAGETDRSWFFSSDTEASLISNAVDGRGSISCLVPDLQLVSSFCSKDGSPINTQIKLNLLANQIYFSWFY